jgi:hypothetical protein
MGTKERGTTRPILASTKMETRRDAMRTFVAVALVSLAIIGVATATMLHTWFKYDEPEVLKEPSTLRQKPLDDYDRD